MTRVSKDIYYPELSYQIVGSTFKVYNSLGYGFREKHYQVALAEELQAGDLTFKREVPFTLRYGQKIIGRYFIDFVIDDKVVLELKIANRVYTKHIQQVLGYLRESGLHLGILVIFKPNDVEIKRIVN